MRRTFLPVLIAAAAAGGCATPYSQIDGARYFRAPIDTYPLTIVAVDGAFAIEKPFRVEPGARQVTVQGPPTATHRLGARQTVSLEVKPCTLYHLVAVKPNRLASDFTVKVDHEEAVPGCVRTG